MPLLALNSGLRVVQTNVILNSGHQMPVFGLGTFHLPKNQIYDSVESALKNGYRLFDTAQVYQTEDELGSALKTLLPKYNLKREDIFIISKLSPANHDKAKAIAAVESSLMNLQMNYIDLYLIHWPGAQGVYSGSDDNRKLRHSAWAGLEKCYKAGQLKSIGVSNFTAQHIQDLLKVTETKPAVNQIEFHPYFVHPPELYEICDKNSIVLQSYSTLGGDESQTLQTDEDISRIAVALNRTPAQILLRWALQSNFCIIPRSSKPTNISSNAELDFQIPKEHFDIINQITMRRKFCWDPAIVE